MSFVGYIGLPVSDDSRGEPFSPTGVSLSKETVSLLWPFVLANQITNTFDQGLCFFGPWWTQDPDQTSSRVVLFIAIGVCRIQPEEG